MRRTALIVGGGHVGMAAAMAAALASSARVVGETAGTFDRLDEAAQQAAAKIEAQRAEVRSAEQHMRDLDANMETSFREGMASLRQPRRSRNYGTKAERVRAGKW